ncbi:MAG: four helix bundle protein [bacterium]|nr:four helix bundle protein [bacterium]MDT8395804.1 four helix bundle protein [bacterium]
MAKLAISFRDLEVYKISMEAAMDVRSLALSFPASEKFSLSDQITRSSRSVCANIAEAWHKRRYRKAFIASLNVAEGEAAETRVWLEFAFRCKYLDQNNFESLDDRFDHICRMLHRMTQTAEKWTRSGN